MRSYLVSLILLLFHVILCVKGRTIQREDDPSCQGASPCKSEMDPELRVFFIVEDLRLQKRLPVYFSRKGPGKSPRFLSREEADSIPFSSTQLPYLLDLFSFPLNSSQAKAMEYTLKQCEMDPILGEISFCATSLESMLESVRHVFGRENKFRLLTTKTTEGYHPLQNYTILNVPEWIDVPRVIGCHTMPYPYAVFYCHSQQTETRLFQISLAGDDGEGVEAVAVCHMDTSQWDPDHVSFKVLSLKPGSSPVCHFFPPDNLIWVPA